MSRGGKRHGGRRHKPEHRPGNYDVYVNKLNQKNIEILKRLGRYNLNSKDPYNRTDGERAVASSLRKLHYRYVPEYVINRKLHGDSKGYRVADFYLPKENIYIEFLGGWEKSEEEKRRYKHKMAVYKSNGIKCVYIWRNNLYNVTHILKTRINETIAGKPSIVTPTGKQPDNLPINPDIKKYEEIPKKLRILEIVLLYVSKGVVVLGLILLAVYILFFEILKYHPLTRMSCWIILISIFALALLIFLSRYLLRFSAVVLKWWIELKFIIKDFLS